ncbi:hypothetical protein L7F22_022235 [Adiantum nelumboides]|nr:hypothetical protein [Adiantum nelumboides]
MGRRGFLCCFSRSPPPNSPPPSSIHISAAHAASAIERNGSKHSPPNQGNVEVLQQQQKIQREVEQIEEKLGCLKGDLAREMGYPLATRLIHEVSAVFDPNVEKMSLRKHPNPWGWLQRNVDFKRALAERGDTVPEDLKSVEAIAFQAAHIMAHSNRKFIKCYPEVLYMELKNYKDKGYMEALSTRDAELHSFLDLSNFFATAFIARPRLLQLTTFMLQRVRDELAIYWHTWEKLPFSWDERWHEAETWFQAAVDCFKDHNNNSQGVMLPETIIELAREFDFIEETTRKIYGGATCVLSLMFLRGSKEISSNYLGKARPLCPQRKYGKCCL